MITIDGRTLSLPRRGPETVAHAYWASRLWKPLSQYFTVDGTNYWPVLSYFVQATNRFFLAYPGTDRLLGLCDALHPFRGRRVALHIDEPDGEVLALVAGQVLPDADVTTTGSRRQWFQRPGVLRLLLSGRLWARWAIGALRGKRSRKPVDALFLTNTRFRHADGSVPLFDGISSALQAQQGSARYLYYTGIPDVQGFLRNLGALFKAESYIGDYYSLRLLRTNKKVFRKLRAAWGAANADTEFRKLFTYKGIDLYEALRPHLRLVFEAFAYMAADNIALGKAIHDSNDFHVLVLDHEENMYGKGLLLTQKRGTKSVALSHELIYPGCNHTFAPDNAAKRPGRLWRPLPDKKCVGGQHAARVLRTYCNYPARRIAITGHPKLDFLFEKRDRSAVLHAHGLSPEKKHILVVSTKKIPAYALYQRIAKENPAYVWVIKPHPKGNEPIIEAMGRARPPRNLVLVDRQADTYALLDASDGVLAGRTSVAMEAACKGKLVLILNPEGERLDDYPYVPNKEGIEVYDAASVTAALHKPESERRKVLARLARYAEEQNAGNDGRASARVAAVILGLARQRRDKRSRAS